MIRPSMIAQLSAFAILTLDLPSAAALHPYLRRPHATE